MRAWLAGRTVLSETVTTFHIRPESPVSFLAGQYIEVVVKHDTADSRGDRRWFTVSNAPGAPLLDLTMRLPRTGMSTFKKRLVGLRDGDELGLGEVLGDFVAPKDKQLQLVFMADGIGVTPFISIVRDLARRKDKRTITLVHELRAPQDALFHDEFRAYGVKLTQSITPQLVETQLYYLAGTESKCLRLQKELVREGVPPMRIALDYFSGYPEA